MKLYMHYKNKPYKYVGIAKHSETQEDVVIYECRYPNERAKVWVRPRKMFEENVNGKPRFAKIEAQIEIVTEITEAHFDLIKPVNEANFPDWDEATFRKRKKGRKGAMLLLASVDQKLVAYKLAYQSDSDIFYSSLGGVLPEYQGVGIGEMLMKAQHEWARKKGFKKIQTKTMNQHKPMLMLNLKSGFEILSIALDPKDNRLKILMEKTL